MKSGRAFVLAPLIAVTMVLPAATAQAKTPKKKSHAKTHHSKKHAAKGPSLKVPGLAVNEQYFKPGTTITEKSPVNACYYIFGEDTTPPSLLFVGFVHAVGIPANAPTTVTLTTPWTTQGLGTVVSEKEVPFSKAMFTNRGHGVALNSGGASSKEDFYRFNSLQGGDLQSGDGRYAIEISVEVAKQTLKASGAITVSC